MQGARYKGQDGRGKIQGQQRIVPLALYLVPCLLYLSSCGFHLRGSGGVTLPPALSSVRVVTAGPAANTPLAAEVREALAQAGARVVEAGEVPIVTLLDERVDSQVASVRTETAKASEYLVRYAATFRLTGPRSLPPQTIRLQADYFFDPAEVLAKEREERELVQAMRRDAARQIVRRLTRALTSSGR